MQCFRPALKKRESVRSVFDGRHRSARHFAPGHRNNATAIEELFK
jgi:arylsulfatase